MEWCVEKMEGEWEAAYLWGGGETAQVDVDVTRTLGRVWAGQAAGGSDCLKTVISAFIYRTFKRLDSVHFS